MHPACASQPEGCTQARVPHKPPGCHGELPVAMLSAVHGWPATAFRWGDTLHNIPFQFCQHHTSPQLWVDVTISVIEMYCHKHAASEDSSWGRNGLATSRHPSRRSPLTPSARSSRCAPTLFVWASTSGSTPPGHATCPAGRALLHAPPRASTRTPTRTPARSGATVMTCCH